MSRVKNLLVVLLFVTTGACVSSTPASSGSYINLNEVLEEMKMGGVKDWLMDMEEDASWMSINEWLDKHGRANQEVYETINGPTQDIFDEEDQMMSMVDNLPLHRISKIVIRKANHGVTTTYGGVEFREFIFYDNTGEKFEVTAYGVEKENIIVEVE